MFTGIIEAQGRVKSFVENRKGRRLVLAVPRSWANLALGSSVAVDGTCLTVSSRAQGALCFDLLKETLRRTRFASLKTGDRLNLERPMINRSRVHGHFVQGHVDGLGQVVESRSSGREKSMRISFPARLKPYIVPKGSIALNGVSMTIGTIRGTSFWVHGIPHTLKKTNLGDLQAGQALHLEADILLKFFHGLTSPRGHYKLVDSRTAFRKWHEKN